MCPVNETELSAELRNVHAACSLILAIVGTFGNGMSLILICRAKLYQGSPVTMLIIDLCVANVVSSGLNLSIVAATSFYRRWIFGDVFCKIFGFITYLSLGSECLIITHLALCHYLVVVHRVQIKDIIFKRRIYFRLFILLGLPWVITASLLLVPLTETWDTFGYDHRYGFCTLINKQNGIGMHAVGSIILIVIMTAIFLYCYPAILYIYIKSHSMTRQLRPLAVGSRKTTHSKRLQHMISAIMINYLATYLPFLITCMADPCLKNIPLPGYLVILYICWSHVAINPFIYALLNRRIHGLWKSSVQHLWSVIVSKFLSSNLTARIRRRNRVNLQIIECHITADTTI